MNEILKFMQKRDERTDRQKAFYNLPTMAFGFRREIKINLTTIETKLTKYNLQIDGLKQE